MRFGIWSPNLAQYGSPQGLLDLALAAEANGWDGFFIWDRLMFNGPVADPQIVLGAAAAATEKITLGALVTALARRRPWKVARELGSLAQLAPGRIVAGIGLGMDDEFHPFSSEPQSLRARRCAMEDGLELLPRMLSGEPVIWEQPEDRVGEYRSTALVVDSPPFLPAPPQPVPIWSAASIMRETDRQPVKPFERAARSNGLFPAPIPWDPQQPLNPAEMQRAVELCFGDLSALPADFDLVAGGTRDALYLDEFEEMGVTWWLLTLPDDGSLEDAHRIIAEGPPGG